jgi:HTH-type transcriptional regulator, transcriptional repressor of NAD biosynthesis genes
MSKGFVFGKFLPFHKGHEGLIRFALTQCDFLTVLICCSDQEDISADQRKSWMANTFSDEKNSEFKVLHYREEELPNTSVSSESVSKIWAEKFKELFPDYDCVITSEKYGDYIASFMNIEHIPFDIHRIQYPVSASQIRENPFQQWQFIPESVKPDFCFKVVILGTESTGKTTLTQNLSQFFNATHVLEAGRDLIPHSTVFNENDLMQVANEHAFRIKESMSTSNQLVIIDTDIHITQSYARFSLEKTLDIPEEIYAVNRAHLYLYLNKDVVFVQDGTRLSEEERNLLDTSHKIILDEYKINYIEINGDWQERFEKAVFEIKKKITDFNC